MFVTRPRRPHGNDTGFTLIELVVTVAILGIIATVLLGVVFQYLKVSGVTQAKLVESTDQQFISTYWQADVSSLGRRDFSPATPSDPVPTKQSVFVGTAAPGGCGTSVGSVVVAFAWNEFAVDAANPGDAWNSTSQEVAYVTTIAGSQTVLQRVRCRNGVADSPMTVAHTLDSATPIKVTCDTACGSATLPNRVSMQFKVRDTSEPGSAGYTTTVTADRRQG